MSRTRLRCLAGATAVLLAVAVASPAAAQCPGEDGTVPGRPAAVYTVSAGGQTLYVDDRGFVDWDDDGDAGGLWIYLESNGEPGLQRGGRHPSPGDVVPLPHVPPVQVLPPDPDRPVFPNGLTLFPYGVGGGGWSEIEPPDDCWSPNPDTLLF